MSTRSKHAFAAACLLTLVLSSAAGAEELTLRLKVQGHRVEGMPLFWSSSRAQLLLRDGRLLSFHPGDAAELQKVADSFHGYSARKLRGQLQREFGSQYEVSGAGHYLVVHPPGRQLWAQRFDTLYRSFIRYFNVRGIRVTQPRFPLVAVVLPDQASFLRYASRRGVQLSRAVDGYYSVLSNRVAIYDLASAGRTWESNGALIIHEASHQAAFNLGVHHRGSPPPRWLSEGLGMMFEAPGVWNSSAYRDRKDRVNQQQLAAFRRYLPRRRPGSLPQFVSSDRKFETAMFDAYGEAWALTFFLSETDPRRFAQYLQATAEVNRAPQPRQPERLQEFVTVFGNDLQMLEARFLRFIEEL